MADFSCTVTPGATVNSSTVLDDPAVLNALGTPQVKIPADAIPAAQLDPVTLAARFGATFRGQNMIPWGTFREELMAAASVSCAAGEYSYPLPQWFVQPTGAAAAVTFNAKTSVTTTVDEYRAALKVTASAGGMTLLECGTKLPAGLCQMLSTGQVTFSIYVRNRTGTSFTPTLRIKTPNSPGDDSSMVLRQSVAGTACADSTWVRQQFTFDASAGTITNWDDGAYLILEITCGGGVMGNGEYVLLAEAQVDAAAAASSPIAVPPALQQVPAGTIFPYGGAVAPPGWALCDGTACAVTKFPALFDVIGYAYGGSAGSFNVPDLRGRTLVGAEVTAASQSRTEISVTIASNTLGTAILGIAAGAGAALRIGMGAFGNAGLPGGVKIKRIGDTEIELTDVTTASVTGTVRFSKLGAADAETLGAAGDGMSAGRRRYKFTIAGCGVINASARITPPGTAQLGDKIPAVRDVLQGMVVSDGGGGFAAGTTVAGFGLNNAGALRTELVASSPYTGATGTVDLTFELVCPEGDEVTMARLAADEVTFYDVTWTNATANFTVGNNARILPGMIATHVSGGGTGFPVGTQRVIDVTTFGAVFASINNNFTNTASNQVVKFSRKVEERATAQTPDTLPAATVNWIIKT